jgi:hypothetical protein
MYSLYDQVLNLPYILQHRQAADTYKARDEIKGTVNTNIHV